MVENSLDAGAQTISVAVWEWGKQRIVVQDDGTGIVVDDMDLVLARYATSKIESDQDIYNLSSYGFRGEALASISEVSKITITTKTIDSDIALQLEKSDKSISQRVVSASFVHGTRVMVEDLFYNVPVRLKFLKSTQTEYVYCYNYFIDISLRHLDKHFVFSKWETVVFDLTPVDTIEQRMQQLFKKDRVSHVKPLSYNDEVLSIVGVAGDATMHFGSGENMRIYVNQRPVQDKIIKRAIMEAYRRQIVPGSYPFIILFLDIAPDLVDVNVHPRKLEVKFLESQKIYDAVYRTVAAVFGEQKIASAGMQASFASSGWFASLPSSLWQPGNSHVHTQSSFFEQPANYTHQEQLGEYRVVGQLWDMYIVLESPDALYYIDQHALAERIAFEKMKKILAEQQKSHTLLQPLTVEIDLLADLEQKLTHLQEIGFEISALGERSLAIYAVPQVFMDFVLDLSLVMQHVLYLEKVSLDHIVDEIFAMKACKASIKAGEKLNYLQMQQLVEDGFAHIDGMFVCQHGRPFFIKIDKKQVDGLMDR